MNSLLSLGLSLLIFSIISVQISSSASFPNPPQFPAPTASADEWALFWKLLHNYYAIIARPRFGKRYDPFLSESKGDGAFIQMVDSNILPSAEVDQGINLDDLYTLTQTDRKRRRRR